MSYDAIVVGARCAGAATALLLARAGRRVLVIDRAPLPSDIPHGHMIHRHGPARLRQWGLLDAVVAGGCPPVETWRTDFGDGVLESAGVSANGVASCYGPRRVAFDRLLADAAVASGAELRERWLVEDVVREADRVAGVKCRPVSGGPIVVERAPVTIGADGRRSTIARQVGAATLVNEAPLTCWYFSYWSDVRSVALEIYQRGERLVFAFPTNDGLFAVFGAWPAGQLAALRRDPAAALQATIDLVPDLAERLREGRRVERLAGASDLPNFKRQAAGPGWALVGDAACHKDPYLALGMCDALRDGDLLAQAILGADDAGRHLDEALAQYAHASAEASHDDFVVNMQLASFAPLPPMAVRLRAALREHPAQARAFYQAREGLIPPETFFNAEKLASLLGWQAPVEALQAFSAVECQRVKRSQGSLTGFPHGAPERSS